MYVEVATPSVEFRGVGIKASSLGTLIEKAQEQKAQLYRSYFMFDEALVKHLEEHHTIKGFEGRHYLDRILFDIDKSANTDEVTLERVRILVDELMSDWTDQIEVWFSGTGYHVITPDFFGFEPSEHLPQDLKATLSLYFPELLETHALCYTASLIRAENTINKKSHLYKTKIPLELLKNANSVKEIHFLAQKPTRYEPTIWLKQELHQDKIVHAIKQNYQKVKSIPTDNVTCSMHIYNEVPGPGSKRYMKALRLASVWRRKGMTPAQCITLLKEWCPNFSGSWKPESPAKVVADVFKGEYEYGCFDEILIKYCDPICRFHKLKNMRTQMIKIQKMSEVEKEYSDHIRDPKHIPLFNLNKVFNIPDCPIEREQIIVLTGDTGLGKSSLTANILLPQKHLKILWVDHENSKRLLYRRLVQIEHNKTKKQIEDHYKESRNTWSHGLEHIAIPNFGITLEQMLEYAANERPDMIVIDTLEMLASEKTFYGDSAELQKVSYSIKRIKDVLHQHRILFWIIHHLKKGAALNWKSELQPLTTDSIKGNSMVAQQGDTILALERVTLSNKDNTRWFRSLKSRDAEPFQTKLTLDGQTMRFK